MSKITLNNVGDLTQVVTAKGTINANSATIQTAFDNTLSRDGTSPNQMLSVLDMNSNRIINLPAPVFPSDPVRLEDTVASQNGIPVGGTTGQVLAKSSNSNYATTWISAATGNMQSSTYDPTGVNGDAFQSSNTKFTQTGTGGVQRSVSNKLTEFVSILDFGAVGNGNIAQANTNAAALNNAIATGKSVRIPYTSSGYHFGTNQINIPDNCFIVGEDLVLLKSTATTSLFLMSGGQGTNPVYSGISNVTIDMTGSGASSSAILMNTFPGSIQTPVSHVRLSNIKCQNCVSFYNEPAGGGYVYDLQVDNIECVLVRGTQINSLRTQGFIRYNNININCTLSGQTLVNYPCMAFSNFAGLELYQIHVTGQAAALGGSAAFTSGATGINLTGVGTPNTPSIGNSFVWMDRVRAESTQDAGMLITNVSFIDGKEVETRGCLGNGIVLTQVYWGQFSTLYASGAKGSTGAAASAHGIVFDTCGQSGGTETGYGGTVVSNLCAENCTGNSVLVRDTKGLMVSSLRLQDSTGWGLQETNTVAGYVGNNTYESAYVNNNTAGTMSLVTSSRAPHSILNLVRFTDLPGTATNNNAAAGDIGEYVVSTVSAGSAISLTSNTATNITSISLTAGDWEIWFEAHFNGAATTTVNNVIASISSTSATLDATAGNFACNGFNNFTVYNVITGAIGITLTVGPQRRSLSSTTTIFAVVQSLFATSTSNAFGVLKARRVR
jgi:hypothetical protein